MKIDYRLGHVESQVGLLVMLASIERSDFKIERGNTDLPGRIVSAPSEMAREMKPQPRQAENNETAWRGVLLDSGGKMGYSVQTQRYAPLARQANWALGCGHVQL